MQIRQKRDESVIEDHVGQSEPAELYEGFKYYEGCVPPSRNGADSHMWSFIISTDEVYNQLTHLNTNKSKGADSQQTLTLVE